MTQLKVNRFKQEPKHLAEIRKIYSYVNSKLTFNELGVLLEFTKKNNFLGITYIDILIAKISDAQNWNEYQAILLLHIAKKNYELITADNNEILTNIKKFRRNFDTEVQNFSKMQNHLKLKYQSRFLPDNYSGFKFTILNILSSSANSLFECINSLPKNKKREAIDLLKNIKTLHSKIVANEYDLKELFNIKDAETNIEC